MNQPVNNAGTADASAGAGIGAETPEIAALRSARRARMLRRVGVGIALAILACALYAASLLIGETWYSPGEVMRVILGQTVPGASYTVGELRLPRATLGLVAGAAFGAAGVIFQTMLRNQLASPDIIGISSGASAAGVTAIVVLQYSQTMVSLVALVGALGTAALIYLLSIKGGFAGTRLILIGIGVAAMLNSVVSYVLSKAAAWDLVTATRWLTGSLNGATWQRVIPVAVCCAVLLPTITVFSRQLGLLRLGDDSAQSLGVTPGRVRVVAILAAVALVAMATSACGPIAFVAFMSGPIASRLVGPAANLVIPAALVGAALVLGADLLGQNLLGTRYPVGVITGVLGAPYLIYLLVRSNRSGASL